MTADWLIVLLLFVIGLVMLLTDIFLLSVFVVGILGLVFMVSGVILSYTYFGNEVGMGVLVTSILLTLVTLYYALSRETWSFMTLNKYADDDISPLPVTEDLLILGQEGITMSTLRPIGTAQFGNDFFEVRTFGKYLDTNSIVYIAKIDRRKIYVESIEAFKAS